MSDIPDAADLLETAREALLSDLLPSLPDERRYVALMIANAMAIAARDFSLGGAAIEREAEQLRALATDIAPPADPAPIAVALLRRTVAAGIRDGRYDDTAQAAALTTALLHIATARLAISNPGALRE